MTGTFVKRLFLLAVAALVAVSLTGAASAQRQATPFKLMMMVGINTAVSSYPEVPPAAQAAADAVNKRGGFGGRPVQIVACNMLGTAAGAAACAQQAVDQKIDWVWFNHSFESAVVPILNANGIPYAGSKLTTGSESRDPNLFPLTPSAGLNVAAPCYAAVKALQKKGVAHPAVAFFVTDVAGSVSAESYCKLAAVRAGGIWKGIVPTTFTSTDYSSSALALKELNPDVIGNAVIPTTEAGVMKAAAQFGLHPIWAIAGGVGTVVLPTLGIPVEAYIGKSTPWQVLPHYPGSKQIRADLAAAGDTDPLAIAELGAQGWLDVYALKKLADLVKGPVTSESMLAKLRTTANITIFPGIHWMPKTRGPALFKNTPNGNAWVARWDQTTNTFVPTNIAPIDVYAAMGIGKTPRFPEDKYPSKP